MRYICMPLLLLLSYCLPAQPTLSDYKARLRSYPLLPNQFFIEDTIQGKHNLAIYNSIDSFILFKKKDSLLIDSRVLANDIIKRVLVLDWPLFKSIRVRYFDKYDIDTGVEWKYDLQFPVLIRYELYNAKKMTGAK